MLSSTVFNNSSLVFLSTFTSWYQSLSIDADNVRNIILFYKYSYNSFHSDLLVSYYKTCKISIVKFY